MNSLRMDSIKIIHRPAIPAALLILAAASVGFRAAAEPGRAPELPGLEQFRDSLKGQEAPAAVSGWAIARTEEADPCGIYDLAHSRVRAGFWTGTYKVEPRQGGPLGVEALTNDYSDLLGYVFKDSSGKTVVNVRAAQTPEGRLFEARDCAGRLIGRISETYSHGQSAFEVFDAGGRRRASTGLVGHQAQRVSLLDRSGAGTARIEMEGRWTDRCAVSVSDPRALDPRLAVFTAVLKLAADYKRSVARRRL